MNDYTAALLATKQHYPFSKWEARGDQLEQYTPENCTRAAKIFDQLIGDLSRLGQAAPEEEKLALFQTAIESLNELNDATYGMLIETEEREVLCELSNTIALAAGIDPSKYGGGEGPASEWRDW